MRWTVDEAIDLDFVRAIYKRLGTISPYFNMIDVLRLLEEEPGLAHINTHLISNEGYYRSIAMEPPLPPNRNKLEVSLMLKEKAEKLIPSCTQTLSKGPSQFIQGIAPVFLKRGDGSHVWDVDGNEYIDYPMALGAIILGHNYPSVIEAVNHQMMEGTTFSLPHPIEVEVAEMLIEIIPCAEMVRFGKNGSDVTAGAIRLARAFTGRDIVACCGYHGWQDWYIGTTSRKKGIPNAIQGLTIPFQYNDLESLRKIFRENPHNVAAVIMEPVGIIEPMDGFLQEVREIATREGAILIFDEIITGFRVSLGGAQQYFNVQPDLACFGKAMANGYPISALVGRKEVMALLDEVFFSFTFGGETLSLAATKATIKEIREKGVLPHIWEMGKRLKDGYNVLARHFGLEGFTKCIGLPPRTVITFQDINGKESLILKSLFQQECLKRGILFSGSHNISFSHTIKDIDYTLRVYRSAMEVMKDAIQSGEPIKSLEGKPIEFIFRRP
jgi:glutamate-1-semialdehyde 2,1-aminomutase/spore coat polysaccharide biosynthesis protein SpsF